MSMAISSVCTAGAPTVMSGASGYAAPAGKLANVFQQIDSDNDGSVNQAQFTQAFQRMNPPAALKSLGAGATFQALDPSGAGNLSKSEFVTRVSQLMRALRNSSGSGSAPAESPTDTLSASLDAFQRLGDSGLDITA